MSGRSTRGPRGRVRAIGHDRPRPARLLCLAATVAALLTVSLSGGHAWAGQYSLKQCEGAEHLVFGGTYATVGGSDRVDVVSGCVPSSPTKLGIYQDRSGMRMAHGVGGQFVWTMPPGERVVATRFDAKLKDANGIAADLVGSEIGAPMVELDAGAAHDGAQRTLRWSDPGRSLSSVHVRLRCESPGGCANQATSPKAFLEVFDVELTINDFRPPVVTPSGTGWERAGTGHWTRGVVSLRADARDDGSGIARAWAEVNGVAVTLGLNVCPFVRGEYAVSARPCSSPVERTGTFDSGGAPFVEGQNRIVICAADFAPSPGGANRSCSGARTLLVDSLPPAEPIDLKPVGGNGWKAENRFGFTWTNPPGQVSPISGGQYRIIDPATGSAVETGEVSEASSGELGPLTVPGPGEYLLELRLRDASGNLGSPTRTAIRFDDRPPGDVAPEPPAGWVSAEELPLRQVIERAAPGGPSGVRGYALAVSPSGPATPCPTGLCLGPELVLTDGPENRTGLIPELAEGSHWVSAVAASGAGVPSERPGSTMVKVDRTPPAARLDGVPDGWANRPVTVTASAIDAGSGMTPRPGEDDGEPVTVIEAEDHAPYAAPGSSASFTVSGEGANRIRYWARDLAGNANDGGMTAGGARRPAPGEAVVRIDTEPPRSTFERDRDPRDPELIRVRIEDDHSGVRSAKVSWRRAGTDGEFSPVPARQVDGRFEARIPSDDLEPGVYELRAEATDLAGNSGTGLLDEAGSPMLIRLPVKEQLTLRAGLGAKARPAIKVGFDGRPLLTGRLTGRGGAGVSGAALTVVESFAAGARPSSRAVRTVTDGTGRFALRLGKGPARRVAVRYQGTGTRSRAAGRPLKVDIRGRTTFRLRPGKLRNGGWVRMTGQVARRGALLPARGKLVALQYFDPARAQWRPVEVLRTNRRGRFRHRYRFRTIATAQRIIFRAVSLAEAGWPYLASTSRRRSVIVFPRR